MAFSEIELKRIDKLIGGMCRAKSPPHIADQLRFEYEISGHNAIVWEIRPVYFDPSRETKHGVAKFQYIRSRNTWKLYWMRADLKWHGYDPDPKQKLNELQEQIEEVERDPYGAFFG